eukprot:5878013-Pleurochrysis_carterae.AAC.1
MGHLEAGCHRTSRCRRRRTADPNPVARGQRRSERRPSPRRRRGGKDAERLQRPRRSGARRAWQMRRQTRRPRSRIERRSQLSSARTLSRRVHVLHCQLRKRRRHRHH